VLEIKIPAGVESGSRLRIGGEGEAGLNGGPPGDLYVVISVKDHSFFKRQGADVYCEIPISFAQAALGAEITVPTLEGKERLKIPGGTQTGSVFRFRGRGVVNLSGRGRGDQLVTVTVVTPTKLSRKQRELFEELSSELDAPYDTEAPDGIFGKVKDIFG
jgi:molecular chaperone DnaJ